jgi:uncharacterized protein (TIGR02996 family)
MSPDNPFLQALLAQPDDDTFRLAITDWFIENGQPERAEFIRVQVELATLTDPLQDQQVGVWRERTLDELLRLQADRRRRQELEVRQRELLIAHGAEWARPLAEALDCGPGEWGGWVFHRGFVEYFNISAEVLLRHGEKLARLTPVRELFLRPCSADELIALCKHHWVRNVTHLYLEGFRMTDAAARALLHTPFLPALRRMRYSEDGMSEGVREAFLEKFARVVGDGG